MKSAIHRRDIRGVLAEIKKSPPHSVNDWCNSDQNLRALAVAAMTGYVGMVKLLLKKGAYLDAQSETELSPLMMAVMRNRLNVVKYLVRKGANVNHVAFVQLRGPPYDSFGTIKCTPLIIACRFATNNTELVKFLLSSGASVDQISHEGATPLHFAAYIGNIEIAMMLLQYGVDHTTQLFEEYSNETAFDVALKRRNYEFADFLTQFCGGTHVKPAVSTVAASSAPPPAAVTVPSIQ